MFVGSPAEGAWFWQKRVVTWKERHRREADDLRKV